MWTSPLHTQWGCSCCHPQWNLQGCEEEGKPLTMTCRTWNVADATRSSHQQSHTTQLGRLQLGAVPHQQGQWHRCVWLWGW